MKAAHDHRCPRCPRCSRACRFCVVDVNIFKYLRCPDLSTAATTSPNSAKLRRPYQRCDQKCKQEGGDEIAGHLRDGSRVHQECKGALVGLIAHPLPADPPDTIVDAPSCPGFHSINDALGGEGCSNFQADAAVNPSGRPRENDRDRGGEGRRRNVGVDGSSLLQRTGQVFHEAGSHTGRLYQRRR